MKNLLKENFKYYGILENRSEDGEMIQASNAISFKGRLEKIIKIMKRVNGEEIGIDGLLFTTVRGIIKYGGKIEDLSGNEYRVIQIEEMSDEQGYHHSEIYLQLLKYV